MLFLIQYDRRAGRLLNIQRFDDDQRDQAARVRLNLEMDLVRRGQNDEVALLEAVSEETLRKTHRRYFEDLDALANAS